MILILQAYKLLGGRISLYLIYKWGTLRPRVQSKRIIASTNRLTWPTVQGPFKPREAIPPCIETQTSSPNSAGATEATRSYQLDLFTNGSRLCRSRGRANNFPSLQQFTHMIPATTARAPPVAYSQLRYKFIVDGEWRFSPQDPYIPDANGNVNNYIDTTNFRHMIDKTKYRKEQPSGREEPNDKQIRFKGVEEFAPSAPRLPPHYGFCSYIKNYQENMEPVNHSEQRPMEDQGSILEQKLTQAEILMLFNSPHCLRPPYHVEVDHLIKQTNKKLGSFCITQRFKSKYTTYRYFMTEGHR